MALNEESCADLGLLAGPIDEETALFDRMSENVIGAWRLPLGVLTGIVINRREHRIAMATEEPSVIAAVNRTAVLFNAVGGIHAEADEPVTRAQIMFRVEEDSVPWVREEILRRKSRYIGIANQSNPGLTGAGGGAFELETETPGDGFVVVRLLVRTMDAMGANAVNTMAEALQQAFVQEYGDAPGYERGMAILTNEGSGRLARARIELPFEMLPGEDGAAFGHRMEMASEFALRSPDRAVTHNKGIMNGVIAAALPLGQDTRAMSASFFDAACRQGRHLPMSRWFTQDDRLNGILEMPVVAGYVGGFRHHPGVEAAFVFDGIRSYQELCHVICSVGLAQNFGALRALMTEGIQAGHMSLHARKYRQS